MATENRRRRTRERASPGDGGGDAGATIVVDGADDIDPATIGAGAGTASGSGTGSDARASHDRGRKRRTGSTGTKAKVALNVEGVGATLHMIHMSLAGLTKTPELVIEEQEAKNLANALANVAQHYNTEMDPIVLAWGNLVFVGAMMYGPRVAMIRLRMALARAERARDVGPGAPLPPEEGVMPDVNAAGPRPRVVNFG